MPFSARPQMTSAAQFVRSSSVALLIQSRAADPALDTRWGEQLLALRVASGRERQRIERRTRDLEHANQPRACAPPAT